MSERSQGLLLLGLFVLAAFVLDKVAGASAWTILLLVVIAFRDAPAAYRSRQDRKALALLIDMLRSQQSIVRESMLGQIQSPQLVGYIREVLAADGSEEREGDVERFPFPGSLRRRVEIGYWLLWLVSAAVLSFAAFTEMTAASRIVALVIAAAAGATAYYMIQVQRRFATIIEVTPFRVSEIWGDGTKRTVLFNRYLELHHEPRRRRLRLSPGDSQFGIGLDYRRLAFNRLLQLVIEYGGFQVGESSQQRADEEL